MTDRCALFGLCLLVLAGCQKPTSPEPEPVAEQVPTAPSKLKPVAQIILDKSIPIDPVKSRTPKIARNDAQIAIKSENGQDVFRGRVGQDWTAPLLVVSMGGQCEQLGKKFGSLTLTQQSDGTQIVFGTCA